MEAETHVLQIDPEVIDPHFTNIVRLYKKWININYTPWFSKTSCKSQVLMVKTHYINLENSPTPISKRISSWILVVTETASCTSSLLRLGLQNWKWESLWRNKFHHVCLIFEVIQLNTMTKLSICAKQCFKCLDLREVHSSFYYLPNKKNQRKYCRLYYNIC